MGKIEFPREGYGGVKRKKAWVEKQYYGSINQRIDKRLKKLFDKSNDAREKCVTRYLRKHLKEIILGGPEKLVEIRKYVLNHYLGVFDDRSKESFNKKILWAFDFDGYRNDKLVKLAKWLDLKTCPYCNAHYTLYLNEKDLKNHPEGLAKFQFDHFLNKADAPFLSMSLYNLIPSCAVCNGSKSGSDWPIKLNPYVTDISSLYTFWINKPCRLWTGAKPNGSIKVLIKPNNIADKDVVETLDHDINLGKRYGRHWDVAQEIFERAYTYPYYSNPDNFKKMGIPPLNDAKFKRIWMGASPEKSDIDNRPLTKFIQDIWDQAITHSPAKGWMP